MITVTDWIKQAACRGMDTNLFFPERGDTDGYKRATAICRACDVRPQCAQYGAELDRQELTPGIFGGLSQRQRRKLKGAA